MSQEKKPVELELVMRSTGELELEVKKELEQEDKSLASLLDNKEEEKQDGTT